MTLQGIDTAARITPTQAKLLKAEGVSFAGRYLVPEAYGKALTAAEAKDLRDAGLAVLLCWETQARRALGGTAAGAADGSAAARCARALGAPAGACVYFAVDYCAGAGDFDAIAAYLRAARLALGETYRCGVYGGFAVVDGMAKRGACDCFWQCAAWSGGRVSPRTAVYQYQWQGGPQAKALAAKAGFAVDLDSCEDPEAAGMWPASGAHRDGGAACEEQTAPWYAGAMAWAEDAGLINDGRPKDALTRAELATVLQRLDRRVDEKLERLLPEEDRAAGTKGCEK